MADFNFITVAELRRSLQNDAAEMQKCLEIGAWKAVHVLAGSIIEALLIDALGSQLNDDPANYKSDKFWELINQAKAAGFLSDEKC